MSGLCSEVGFDFSDSPALETVTKMVQSQLVELWRIGRAFPELASRVEPVPADILLAMVEMGMPMAGLQEYAMRSNRVSLPSPSATMTGKQTAILYMGNKARHPIHIPEHLPKMPSNHSYIRRGLGSPSLTMRVREKAASQKSDVERALTRCIFKTGNIHNLFKTDDSNLFPLISCEKNEEGMKVPHYLDALMFKDQVFEEDEREYLPKKRKAATSHHDFDDDDESVDKKAG